MIRHTISPSFEVCLGFRFLWSFLQGTPTIFFHLSTLPPSFFPSPPAPCRGLTPLERELESIEGLGVSLVKPPAEVHPFFVGWVGEKIRRKRFEIERMVRLKVDPPQKKTRDVFWRVYVFLLGNVCGGKVVVNSFVIFSRWILAIFVSCVTAERAKELSELQ